MWAVDVPLNFLVATFSKYKETGNINFNNLTRDEVQKRTEILDESYSAEAQMALDKYKLKSIELRAFDYVRQVNLFEFLYKKIPNKFEYVFLVKKKKEHVHKGKTTQWVHQKIKKLIYY